MVSKDYMAGFFDADGYIGVVKGSSGYYNLKCTGLINTKEVTKKRDSIYEELKSMKKTEYNGDGV